MAALAGIAAVLSSQASERLRIPAPAFLLTVAVAARLLFWFGWHDALLIGTALAPTDPAVVFSVLGRREIAEPQGLHRFVITSGAAAANTAVGSLPLPEDAWISFIIRDGRLVPAHADTMLQPNDEVVVLADHNDGASMRELFGS